MVPQSKATGHGRSAERAGKPCLVGRHQLTFHLPVTPAEEETTHTSYVCVCEHVRM